MERRGESRYKQKCSLLLLNLFYEERRAKRTRLD
jgi:hypothetical protein